MPQQSHILVADVPRAHAVIAACLPGKNLQFVQTVEGARSALAAVDFDAVVVGLQFDDCQLFPLLEHMRARPKYRGIPVVCVRTMPSVMPRALQPCVEQALRMMGVTIFLEINGTNHREVCRRLKDIAGKPDLAGEPRPTARPGPAGAA
jgi:CheY-like chemotaxis protein